MYSVPLRTLQDDFVTENRVRWGVFALVSDVHGSRKSSIAKGETQIAEDPSWTGDVIAPAR